MRHERFKFPDEASLLARAAELGIDLPYAEAIGPLLQPLRIAGRQLTSRLVIQPMEGCDGERSGAPGPLTRRRWERFAAGGAALLWGEATAVCREGRANPRQLWLHRGSVAAFGELVAVTRRAAREQVGRDPVLILQLTHSGRYSRPEGPSAPIVAWPNPLLDRPSLVSAGLHVISDDELDALRERFIEAAGLAREAGFDGVDIKACHGYLVSELLGARQRGPGRYGGDFEARARFLLEVVRQIHERDPELLLACRFNAADGIAYPHGFGMDAGEPGRPDLREPRRLARLLHNAGCGLVNVSAGIPYVNPHWGRPFDQPLVDAAPPEEHPLEGIARLIGFAEAIQSSVPELPVVSTGWSWLRHLFPRVAAGLLQRGGAALVGVGRFGFACPDFARQLAAHGRIDPKRSCTACSRCSQLMRDGGRAGCVVRDTEIYVPEYRKYRKPAR